MRTPPPRGVRAQLPGGRGRRSGRRPARVKGFLSPSAAAGFKPQPRHAGDPADRGAAEQPGQRRDQLPGAGRSARWTSNGILDPVGGTAAPRRTGCRSRTASRSDAGCSSPSRRRCCCSASKRSAPTTTLVRCTSGTATTPPGAGSAVHAEQHAAEQRPTEMLNWLTAGPSPADPDAVEPLPEGTSLIGNVPAVSNDKLQINLNVQATPPDDDLALDRLRRQLMWSLRPNLPGVLELRIGHNQVPATSDRHRVPQSSNATFALADKPERFVVYNGEIRRLAGRRTQASRCRCCPPRPTATSAGPRSAPPAPGLRGGSGERGRRRSLRVAAARTGEQARSRRCAVSGQIGHPVWAVTPEDPERFRHRSGHRRRKLYSFGAEGGAARRIDLPGPAGAITAVAVAPDARRVALVVGGRAVPDACWWRAATVCSSPPARRSWSGRRCAR